MTISRSSIVGILHFLLNQTLLCCGILLSYPRSQSRDAFEREPGIRHCYFAQVLKLDTKSWYMIMDVDRGSMTSILVASCLEDVRYHCTKQQLRWTSAIYPPMRPAPPHSSFCSFSHFRPICDPYQSHDPVFLSCT